MAATAAAPAQAGLIYADRWGGPGSGYGQFDFNASHQNGVAFDRAGNVLVTDDLNERVQRFSPSGGNPGGVTIFGTDWSHSIPGVQPGELADPYDVAVNPLNGNVFVLDPGTRKVVVYSGSGAFLYQWGSGGNGTGQLAYPWAIAIDSRGDVYVSDVSLNRVLHFTASGAYRGGYFSAGADKSPRGLDYPSDLAVAGDQLLVAEYYGQRIKRLDIGTGGGLTYAGNVGKPGAFPILGALYNPYSVTAYNGSIFVADDQDVDEFALSDGTPLSLTLRCCGGARKISPRGIGASAGGVYVADFLDTPGIGVLRYAYDAAPSYGKTVAVRDAGGTVRYRSPTADHYTTLTKDRAIPSGYYVDTTRGVVELTSATSRGAGAGTQTARFSGGVFQIGQTRASALTTARLADPLACSTRARSSARRKRRLFGSGKGRFSTQGRFGAATVRGTKWLVEDTCAGTTVKVTEGTVSFRDFTRRRTVSVTAGHSYTARPR